MNQTNKDIIKFISNNKNKLKNHIDLYQNNLIVIFIDIIKSTLAEIIDVPVYIPQLLKKQHNFKYVSLYDFFKSYKVIHTYHDFTKYYTENQHQLDLNKIKYDIRNNSELLGIYSEIYEKNDERSELRNLFYKNTFVSIDVLTEIELNDLNHIVIDNNIYRLSVYYYGNIDINKYLKNIINIINVIKNFNIFYGHTHVKFNIIIFMGNIKKKLAGKTITPMSMNSGSAIPGIYINIWRREELEKVLIHELLHFIKADFYKSENNSMLLEQSIKQIISYEGINCPNESYNETLAGIINMCYKSVKYEININKIYEIELNFLYIQTAKLICLFNGNSITDLFDKKITIKQTTSALSYIVLKMIFFHHIQFITEFISNIKLKCNDSEKIKLFEKLLIERISDKTYVSCVDHFIEILKKTRDDELVKHTLMMSII